MKDEINHEYKKLLADCKIDKSVPYTTDLWVEQSGSTTFSIWETHSRNKIIVWTKNGDRRIRVYANGHHEVIDEIAYNPVQQNSESTKGKTHHVYMMHGISRYIKRNGDKWGIHTYNNSWDGRISKSKTEFLIRAITKKDFLKNQSVVNELLKLIISAELIIPQSIQTLSITSISIPPATVLQIFDGWDLNYAFWKMVDDDLILGGLD